MMHTLPGDQLKGCVLSIELADVIGQLRAELTTAMRAGEDSELQFEVGPVELELSVAVDREKKPGAKVRFWVLEVGAEAASKSSTTQRVTLTLDPHPAGQDAPALISGDEEPGER